MKYSLPLLAHELAHGLAGAYGYGCSRFHVGVARDDYGGLWVTTNEPRADLAATCGETLAGLMVDGILHNQSIDLGDWLDMSPAIAASAEALDIARDRVAAGDDDADGDALRAIRESAACSPQELLRASRLAWQGARTAVEIFLRRPRELVVMGRALEAIGPDECLVFNARTLTKAAWRDGKFGCTIGQRDAQIDYGDERVVEALMFRARLMVG